MSVQVDVLGPLRVRVDGVERRPGGRRERVVLALLASARGEQVPSDRLIDDVWGLEPPPSAAGSLQVAVSRLRTALDPDRSSGGASVLQRGPAGYALVGADLDAERFSAAAAALTHRSPEERLDLSEEALGWWRGTPYADVHDVAALGPEVERLAEDRLRLVEGRADALLALGRHDEVHTLLAGSVTDNPYRERMWAQLALAFYRCDRQAEALDVLRRLRSNLADDLGVDPSAALAGLERDVLNQADHLAAPAPVETPAQRRTTGVAKRPRTTVVGRESVLETFDAALDDLVAQGRGGLLLVTGEPGIGKTRLMEELGLRAEGLGAKVCVGRCHEADVAPPYWPWLPVLRELVGTAPPPEVAVLLGESGHAAPQVVDAASAALRTYDAATRVIAAVEEPMVIILEDLHWSDPSSLRLLAYAAEALGEAPILFVATAREPGAGADPTFTQAMAGMARLGARRVRIPRLGPEDVSVLAREVIEDAPSDLVDVLARRTDGNPFFVLELSRLLAAEGRADAASASELNVPDGVADVLRLRVLQVDPADRQALQAASVMGREFSAVVVAHACGTDVPVTLEALDSAAAVGVVEPGDDQGVFRFVHALTRETVYSDLRPGERAQWHARVGAALAERLKAEPDLVSEVAHHHARAAAYLPDQVLTAVQHGSAAALAAEQRGAFDEALNLWTEVLDVERRAPVADVARRHGLLLRMVTARQRVGDMVGAQAAIDEATAIARSEDDYVRMARAVTSLHSGGLWHWRDMGSEHQGTVETVERCLEHVTDVGLRARLLATLGVELYVTWRSEESVARGEQSLELARAHGDPEVLRDCLANRSLVLWTPGNTRVLEENARESLTLQLPDEYRISAHFQLAAALHRQARSDESDHEMAQAVDLARRLRHTGSDVPLAWWAWLRARETLAPNADELAATALDTHRRTTMVGLTELSGLSTILRLPDGAPVPADVVASADGHPHPAFVAGVAAGLARSGDHERALRLLGPARGAHERDYASLFAWCSRVEVLSIVGDRAGLIDAVDRIKPYADEVSTYGSVVSLGSTALYIGIGLAALGETAEAREQLTQAVAAHAAAGSRRWEAVAQQRLEDL